MADTQSLVDMSPLVPSIITGVLDGLLTNPDIKLNNSPDAIAAIVKAIAGQVVSGVLAGLNPKLTGKVVAVDGDSITVAMDTPGSLADGALNPAADGPINFTRFLKVHGTGKMAGFRLPCLGSTLGADGKVVVRITGAALTLAANDPVEFE